MCNQTPANSTSDAIMDTEGHSDGNETSEGVLLHLRVLEQFEKDIRGTKVNGLFLGTVSSYRPKEHHEGAMMGANYNVKFDFGISKELSPDEVIACANIFYQYKEGSSQLKELPVFSSIAGSVESSSRRGRQILFAHNNWPLRVEDLSLLEKERNNFASVANSKGIAVPQRVDPVWFALEEQPESGKGETEKTSGSILKSVKPLRLKKTTSVTFSKRVKEDSEALATLASVSALASHVDKKPTARRSLSDEAAEIWKNQGSQSPVLKDSSDRLQDSNTPNVSKSQMDPTEPLPSRRDYSDSSENSTHRAGTPKAGNTPPPFGITRGISSDVGMSIPSLNDNSNGPRKAMQRPSLTRKVSFGKSVSGETRGAVEQGHEPGQKRGRGSFSIDPPRHLKRQRSHADDTNGDSRHNRPSPVSNRQFSTDSGRFSFGDGLDFSLPVQFRSGERPPPALRKGDRSFSIESYGSLPPPAVIRASDRQFSVESFMSVKSFDSGTQPLTPNSRLIPSAIGQASPSSHETPNGQRIDDLYKQLDNYVESHPKSPGMPFQRHLADENASSSTLHVGAKGPDKRAATDVNKATKSEPLNAGLEPIRTHGQRQYSVPATHLGQGGVYRQPHGLQQSSRMQSEPLVRSAPSTNGSFPQNHQRPMMPESGLQQWLSGNSSEPMGPEPMMGQSEPINSFPPGHYSQAFHRPYGTMTSSGRGHSSMYGGPHQFREGGFSHPMSNAHRPFRDASLMQTPIQNAMNSGASKPGERQDLQRLTRVNSLVQFGHPQSPVVEGHQLYSRHRLMVCGAHKSDIRLLNWEEKEGCDSLLLINPGSINQKEDLEVVEHKILLKNGGMALFTNFKKKLPVRIFRLAKYKNGMSGFRYDGLYTPYNIIDEAGKSCSRLATGTKVVTFMLKRNPAGPRAKFSNRTMVEDLFEMIKRGSFNSVPTRGDLQIPSLSHSMPMKPQNYISTSSVPPMDPRSHLMGGMGYPSIGHNISMPFPSVPAPHGCRNTPTPTMGRQPSLSRAQMQRQTSAEVSVLHIRYFDDPTHMKGAGGPGADVPMHHGLHPSAMHPVLHAPIHNMQMHPHPSMHPPMPTSMPPHHTMYGHPNKSL